MFDERRKQARKAVQGAKDSRSLGGEEACPRIGRLGESQVVASLSASFESVTGELEREMVVCFLAFIYFRS